MHSAIPCGKALFAGIHTIVWLPGYVLGGTQLWLNMKGIWIIKEIRLSRCIKLYHDALLLNPSFLSLSQRFKRKIGLPQYYLKFIDVANIVITAIIFRFILTFFDVCLISFQSLYSKLLLSCCSFLHITKSYHPSEYASWNGINNENMKQNS